MPTRPDLGRQVHRQAPVPTGSSFSNGKPRAARSRLQLSLMVGSRLVFSTGRSRLLGRSVDALGAGTGFYLRIPGQLAAMANLCPPFGGSGRALVRDGSDR